MEPEPPEQPEQRETISALDPSLPSVPPAQADLTSPLPPPRSARPFVLLGIGIVVLAIAAAYAIGRRPAAPSPFASPTGGQPTEQSARLAIAAGCTPVVVVGDLDASHVTEPETVDYGIEPPAGGPHYGSVARTGVHAEPVPPELLGHNMEHGHVVIWYGSSLAPDVIDALVPVVRANPTGVVMTPRPELEPAGLALAFTAWGRVATCTATTTPGDVRAFAIDFIRTYGANGPEGFIAGDPL